MTLDDLTVNFSHLKREEILSDWVWLIGKNKLPILLTASGDAFLQDTNDNSISILDVGAGEVHNVAGSFEEFKELLSDKEFVVNYLAVDMVGDLMQNNIVLNQGQIYSFKKPPILGGEYILENIEPTDIEVHFSITGQIHKKVKDLPAGTPINEVSISE